MNGWKDIRMNGRMNGWMEWKGDRMNGRMNGWMEWMVDCGMDGCVGEKRRMNGFWRLRRTNWAGAGRTSL